MHKTRRAPETGALQALQDALYFFFAAFLAAFFFGAAFLAAFFFAAFFAMVLKGLMTNVSFRTIYGSLAMKDVRTIFC